MKVKTKLQLKKDLDSAKQDLKHFVGNHKQQVELYKNNFTVGLDSNDKWVYKYLFDMKQQKINILKNVIYGG